MKWLTEGVHQTSDDLTVANTAYFWHTSFWRTVDSNMKYQACSLFTEYCWIIGGTVLTLWGQAEVKASCAAVFLSDSILRLSYFYPTLSCWCNSLNKKAQKELYERRQQQIGDEDFFFLYFLGSATIQWVREFSLNTIEIVASPSQIH